MRANVGDELIVGKSPSCGARVGKIVAVRGGGGSPPYLVHWVAGDYDSLVTPWPGVRIRHQQPWPRQKEGRETRVVSPFRQAARG